MNQTRARSRDSRSGLSSVTCRTARRAEKTSRATSGCARAEKTSTARRLQTPRRRPLRKISGQGLRSKQHTSQFLRALLLERFEVLVDDGHREQDAGAAPDGTHEVGDDGEHADAHPAERGGGRDVPVELLLQRGLAVADHEHLLLLKLLSDVARGGAGDLDPRLGEQSARAQHEGEVEHCVQRIRHNVGKGRGRGDVVRQAADGNELAGALCFLPPPQQLHEEVPAVALEKQLRDEVQVGHQCGLQDDGHVARVEELDGVGLLHAAAALAADGQVHAEALEVDHDQEDQDCGEQVGDVGHVRPVKRLLECAHLVAAGDEQVEQGDDGALELGATAGVHGGGGEGLPDDALALVRGDEQGDARAKAVALRQQLVQADHNDTRHEELQDDQDGVPSAELAHVAVDAGHDVRDSLADSDQNAEELLRAVTAS